MFIKVFKFFLVLLLALVIMILAAAYYFEQGVHPVINLDKPLVYQIKSGQSANGLLNQMKSKFEGNSIFY